MGVGKTLQMLSLVHTLVEQREVLQHKPGDRKPVGHAVVGPGRAVPPPRRPLHLVHEDAEDPGLRAAVERGEALRQPGLKSQKPAMSTFLTCFFVCFQYFFERFGRP